jgi:two-component system phosphate regulon response regulator PhoB
VTPPATGRPTRRRLVLVVDDDDMIRRLVRDVLEVDEVDVVEARNGEAALAQLEETSPGLVVLDIMMPGLDGVEVCRRLDHSLVKVLVLTARDDPSLEEECRAAGADDFLTKPFSSIDLLDKVVELLPG